MTLAFPSPDHSVNVSRVKPRRCIRLCAGAALFAGTVASGGEASAQTQSGQPGGSGAARRDASELARQVQNPISALISLPFQNNTNFNYGPNGHTQNTLNIQPVIPVNLNQDWNLITRTIFPLVSQPEFFPGQGTTFGLASTQFSAFLSPVRPTNGVTWGVGAIVQAPTTTDRALGGTAWGGGPTAVAVVSKGAWVMGALVNNVWSLGTEPHNRYNNFTVQPFFNYNIPDSDGAYASFSPIITANWEARSNQQWTVPLGLAFGKVFHIGNQAINAQIGGYYNVIRPDIGPEYQLRAQITFLFPE